MRDNKSKIILFTSQSSIYKYWTTSLYNTYESLHVDTHEKLDAYLDNEIVNHIIMIDEQSVKDIDSFLNYLKQYPKLDVVIFNALPKVHHAFTLIRNNVKGYENSYINKINLINMLENIQNGKKWLFSDLTDYIINKFIDTTKLNEPEFMPLLTAKEKTISLLVADGLSNKNIAYKEKIALSTVKNHMKNIFLKAGVSDRVSLALKFR